MSSYRKSGKPIVSPWYGPKCILVDHYGDNKSWCEYLRSEGYLCDTYAPGTMEQADKDIRDFLVWAYSADINAWARKNNLGGKWQYVFSIWNDYDSIPNTRQKCGQIGAVATNARYGGKTKTTTTLRRTKISKTRRR